MNMTKLFRILIWISFILLFIFLVQTWLTSKSYLFTPEVISKVVNKHIGKDVKASMRKIHHELESSYPGHIMPESQHQWIFITSGGAMGAICVLHASITEYIVLFGTAVDTSGHSGRHWVNFTDTLISGEMRQWQEGSMKANVFKAGDTVSHYWGEAGAVRFMADTWMLEYGRGFIPSTLPFALSNSVFSTQDVVSILYLIKAYSIGLYMEAKHCIAMSLK